MDEDYNKDFDLGLEQQVSQSILNIPAVHNFYVKMTKMEDRDKLTQPMRMALYDEQKESDKKKRTTPQQEVSEQYSLNSSSSDSSSDDEDIDESIMVVNKAPTLNEVWQAQKERQIAMDYAQQKQQQVQQQVQQQIQNKPSSIKQSLLSKMKDKVNQGKKAD